MAGEKKVPGLFTDPWRHASSMAPVEALKPSEMPAIAGQQQPPQIQDSETDATPDVKDVEKFAIIELKNYGGITVEGTDIALSAASRILEFCIDHKKDIEPILTEYGIVLAKMEVKTMPNIKFYVQRRDGWMLAIPNVASRDAGCMQLIQAMLRIQLQPNLNKKLESYKIRPYKH